MKIAGLLLISFLSFNVFADDEAACVKAEEAARNCCSNPKSCMSDGELETAQELEKLSRSPASEKNKKDMQDLKTDLNHDAMDNCHKAVKNCKSSCNDVDVKLEQKCEKESFHADMFKQHINSVIIPWTDDNDRN